MRHDGVCRRERNARRGDTAVAAVAAAH
jgi:hypothetical protein